ncbi:MAG: hypothetical protein ACO3IV_06700 [Ilumatobacteraceae bacterium]
MRRVVLMFSATFGIAVGACASSPPDASPTLESTPPSTIQTEPFDPDNCAQKRWGSDPRFVRARTTPFVNHPTPDLTAVNERITGKVTRTSPATADRLILQVEDRESFHIPGDNWYVRAVNMTNVSTEAVDYQAQVTFTNSSGRTVEGNSLGVPPQPGRSVILPGETGILWLTAGWNELGVNPYVKGRDTVSVVVRLLNAVTRTPVQEFRHVDNVSIANRVDSETYVRVPLSGIVVDAETNRPLVNAEVEVKHPTLGVHVATTGGDGRFRADLYAFRSTYSGDWMPHYVTVGRRNYGSCSFALEAQPDDSFDLEVRVARTPPPDQWRIAHRWSGELNLNRSKVSGDGRIAAIAESHSILPRDAAEAAYRNRGHLRVFSTRDGHLWSRPLGGETFAIDVNNDGSLIATSIDIPGESFGVVLYDGNGDVVWVADDRSISRQVSPNGLRNQAFRSVAISPDSTVLMGGTWDGRLYVWSITDRKLLYSRTFPDQIGRIQIFDSGDYLVGSGNGYLYMLDASGTVRWLTYLGAAPIAWEFSKNYIIAAGKQATHLTALDYNGRILWEFETTSTTHDIDISPDERFIVARSSAGQYSSVVLTTDGMVKGSLANGEPAAFFSDSRTMLLSGHTMVGESANVWIAVGDVNGTVRWSDMNLAPTIHRGPTGGLAWISPDDRYAIVASGHHVYNLVARD